MFLAPRGMNERYLDTGRREAPEAVPPAAEPMDDRPGRRRLRHEVPPL